VSPDDSVLQAISVMAEKSIGALVVIAGQTLVGIISERDYALKHEPGRFVRDQVLKLATEVVQ
jgi:CBS domain-containing protein